MPLTFSPWIDIPFALFIYGVTLRGLLRWVHRTDQEEVEKTRHSTRKICMRLAEITVLSLLICYAVNLPFWCVSLIGLGLITFPGPPDELLLRPLFLPIVVFAQIIRWYVIGCPDMVLVPPNHSNSSVSEQNRLASFVGKNAIATGPLRPQGEIEIDGIRLSARSWDGKMISDGTQVSVTGVQSDKLLVQEI